MKFQYTRTLALDTRGQPVRRPMVEVIVEGPTGKRATVVGLIDSGADTSLMNSRYAEVLGIMLDDLPRKQFIGIGGVPVTTRFGQVPVHIKHVGGVLHLPVAFTDSPAVDVLLGQEVLFNAYHICFLKDDDLFEIEESRAFRFAESVLGPERRP